MIVEALWSPPATGLTGGRWPSPVEITGDLSDWRIYSDLGLRVTPTGFTIFFDFLLFGHQPFTPPDHPAFLELVDPLSLARDVNGLPLVTAGKFPVAEAAGAL